MKPSAPLVSVAVAALLLPAAIAVAGDLILTKEPINDAQGRRCGIRLFVRSTYEGPVKVRASVVSRKNVQGELLEEPFFLKPDTLTRYGSFMQADRSEAWSVQTRVDTAE